MDAGASIGRHSPLQRFIGCEQAKVLGLGVAMGPVMFYHALEDAMGDAFPIPVWEHNTALLACLDHHGKRWEVTVRPLDPLLAQRRIDQPGRGDLRDYFQDEFDAAGLRPWTSERCGIVVHPGAGVFGSFAPAGGRERDDLRQPGATGGAAHFAWRWHPGRKRIKKTARCDPGGFHEARPDIKPAGYPPSSRATQHTAAR